MKRFIHNYSKKNLVYTRYWANFQDLTIVSLHAVVHESRWFISCILIMFVIFSLIWINERRKIRTNDKIFHIHRLTPPLLATILIYIAVLKYITDGPFWPAFTAKMAFNCVVYGWMNILYVNNFLPLQDQVSYLKIYVICVYLSSFTVYRSVLVFISGFSIVFHFSIDFLLH